MLSERSGINYGSLTILLYSATLAQCHLCLSKEPPIFVFFDSENSNLRLLVKGEEI